MDWNLDEAIAHYKKQGAPREQTALVGLLREIQLESGGTIPESLLGEIAAAYEIRESFLLAIVKRIPSLRLANTHILELCAGPNCGKHAPLAASAEKLHAASGERFSLHLRPCMRSCAKGPNLKWDGRIYHAADEALLHKLLKEAHIDF